MARGRAVRKDGAAKQEAGQEKRRRAEDLGGGGVRAAGLKKRLHLRRLGLILALTV